MPAPAHARQRPVHVHGAEVSTDQALLWDYAEALALLVALVALLAAAWATAAPRPDADLVQPQSIAPISGQFERVPGDTRDAVQADPDGPGQVAVVRPGASFAEPITEVPEAPLADAARAASTTP